MAWTSGFDCDAKGKIGRFEKGVLLFCNYDEPAIVIEKCLEPTITQLTLPKEMARNGRVYPVTELSEQAFLGCENLIEIELSESIKKIAAGAFHNCHGLRVIKVNNKIPPAFSSHFGKELAWSEVFEPYHKQVVIVVPEGCCEVYRNNPEWSNFYSIVDVMPSRTELNLNEKNMKINQLKSDIKKVDKDIARLDEWLGALRRARNFATGKK